MAPVCTKCDQPLDTIGEVMWATEERDCRCMDTQHPRSEYSLEHERWIPCGGCRGGGVVEAVQRLVYQCPGCEVNGAMTVHKRVVTERDDPMAQRRVHARARAWPTYQQWMPESVGTPVRAGPSWRPSWRQKIRGWAFQRQVTPSHYQEPPMARNQPQSTPRYPRPPMPQYQGPPVSSYPRPDYQSPCQNPYTSPYTSPCTSYYQRHCQEPYQSPYQRPNQEQWDSYYPWRQGQPW